MDNLKDFTKAEFLSFLYAEKSREIENNSIPGWNKWVLWGAIITILIFLYKSFIFNYLDYDYKVAGIYITTLFAIMMFVNHYCLSNNNGRLFVNGKVRKLKEEAPILSCVFEFFLCLICFIAQLFGDRNFIVFLNLIIGLVLNVIILVYIIVNQNEFVLARLKTRVFVSDTIDRLFHWLLGCTYLNTIIFSAASFIHYCYPKFFQIEFELSIGITSFISILYLLLKLQNTNTKVAEGIDRIIDKFVLGTITQEESYSQYILLIYGYSTYQVIQKYSDIILLVENNYDEMKKHLEDVELQIGKEKKTPDEIASVLEELSYYLISYGKALDAIQNASKDITKLQKIQPILDNKFVETIKQLRNSGGHINTLQKQAKSIINEIETYFKENYYCAKYDSCCIKNNCDNRKDSISIKNKIKIWYIRRLKK